MKNEHLKNQNRNDGCIHKNINLNMNIDIHKVYLNILRKSTMSWNISTYFSPAEDATPKRKIEIVNVWICIKILIEILIQTWI